jgi:hypothetical protein
MSFRVLFLNISISPLFFGDQRITLSTKTQVKTHIMNYGMLIAFFYGNLGGLSDTQAKIEELERLWP